MEIICAPIPTFSLQTDWGIVGDETSQLCPLLIFVGVQRCCSAELWGRHVSVVLWASPCKRDISEQRDLWQVATIGLSQSIARIGPSGIKSREAPH